MYVSRLFVVAAALASFGSVLSAPVDDELRTAGVVVPNIDPASSPLDALAELQAAAMQAAEHNESKRKRGPDHRCTLLNARVRKDWDYLSKQERKDYIKAVQCIRRLPSKGPKDWVAAKTRYDDFAAIHVNLTMTIHGNGPFITWHRYFVWAYETALRDECGYKGAQPYWNWFANTNDLTKSPVFDGSDTSMGGDGTFVKHNGSLAGARLISLPSGKGGGCIKSGPFKGIESSIGPFNPGMDGLGPIAAGLNVSNPHCIKRDLSAYAATKWFTTENLLNVTIGPGSWTHARYWQEIQGRYPDQFLGLHTTGHYAINGENSDLYSSPNDPVFFLHHSMFDRMYWIHQLLHPGESRKVTGTLTLQNRPPSRNATIDDILDIGVNGPPLPIKDMFDTLGDSPLCYIYL
jgi:tyrosinase